MSTISRKPDSSKSRSQREEDSSRNKTKQPSERDEDIVNPTGLTPKLDAFLNSSSKSKNSRRTQSKTVTNTKLNLRSEHKYDEILYGCQTQNIFSIEIFIHWYNENPSHYEQKWDTIFSDFRISTKNENLSYVYLLLDSRKFSDTRNIKWSDFIESIFYICKGKRKKPYKHIQEAEKYLLSGNQCAEAKIRRMHDIWRTKKPVMILTIFKNVADEDAYTREACMIDAIGKHRLCRKIVGSYYGTAATLTVREKRELGAILLVKARQDLMRFGVERMYPKVWNLSGVKKDEVKNSDEYDYDWLYL